VGSQRLTAELRHGLVLSVCLKVINFVCQIFQLFIPKMSTGFMFYIVEVISVHISHILHTEKKIREIQEQSHGASSGFNF
jgi:Na+/alanine symporter